MADKQMLVKNAFFEDDKKNMYFYYTGKDCVLGLQQPDFIFRNDSAYKYVRVAFCKFNDIGDPDQYCHVDEIIDVTTLTSTVSIDQITNSQSIQIHLQCSGRDGRVEQGTVRCSVTDHNVLNDNKLDPEVIVTEDTYTDSEKKTRYGVGVWVNIDGMKYVLTKVEKSIAATFAPLDADSFPSTYITEYISDNTATPDENAVKVYDFLNAKKIIEANAALRFVDERLADLEKKTANEPHQFAQNTAVYNPAYKPAKAKVEEFVTVTGIREATTERIIVQDNVNKGFSVRKAGMYMLQLKQGFYIDQGESRCDIKIYKNNEEIKEMSMSLYLTSNEAGKDDQGKVIKNIFSSNAYVVRLIPTDVIKVGVTWMDITNISVENETMLSVTALQYNLT